MRYIHTFTHVWNPINESYVVAEQPRHITHTKAPGMQCTKHLWGGTVALEQEGCWTYRRWHQMWDLSVGFSNGKPDVWDGLLDHKDHVRRRERSFPVERRKSQQGVLCATVFNISMGKHRSDHEELEKSCLWNVWGGLICHLLVTRLHPS